MIEYVHEPGRIGKVGKQIGQVAVFINDLNTGFGLSQVDFLPSYLNRFPLFELVFALEFKPQNLILEPSNFKKI